MARTRQHANNRDIHAGRPFGETGSLGIVVAPKLRSGRFKATDKLIASLKPQLLCGARQNGLKQSLKDETLHNNMRGITTTGRAVGTPTWRIQPSQTRFLKDHFSTTATAWHSRATQCASIKPSAANPSKRLNQKNIDRDQILNDSLMTASRPARHHPECWTGLSRNGGPPSPEYASASKATFALKAGQVVASRSFHRNYSYCGKYSSHFTYIDLSEKS